MTVEQKTLTISTDQAGQRLDRVLQKAFPQAGFALVNKLCRKGAVRVDGKRAKGDVRVALGQIVALPQSLYSAEPVDVKPQGLSKNQLAMIRKNVLFRDEAILVFNKPAGLSVQGGSGQRYSLDAMMAEAYPDLSPKLTHRLDKETSGCLIFGLGTAAARTLARQFAEHEVQKIYWAVVSGMVMDSEGEVDFALTKSGPDGAQKMRIDNKSGKSAETYYKRLARKGSVQWLELHPRTGRTHQLRAHLSALGAPILGDLKYDGVDNRPVDLATQKHMYLHARQIHFIHPVSGHKVAYTAPLPAYFDDLFKRYGWGA